jgi:flavodoxin
MMNYKNILSLVSLLVLSIFIISSPLLAQTAARDSSSQDKPLSALISAEDSAALETFFGKNLIIVYSVTGNTLDMANIIQSITKGDIYRIETEETYPSGEDLIPYAKKERDELRVPTLKGTPPSLEEYDYIFLGTPVWFHDIPPATLLFLSQTDFAGKKLIPFITAGGGPGDSIDSITKNAKNAKIVSSKLITRYAALPKNEIQVDIINWLKTIMNSDSPAN